MYITPFVPHTFATRANGKNELGLILALTYGNALAGDAKMELSALGQEIASNFAFDFSSREKTFAALLQFHREGSSLSRERVAQQAGVSLEALSTYESGREIPSESVMGALADILGVNIRDLMPFDRQEEKVMVRFHAENPSWVYPHDTKAYYVVELAGTRNLPYSKSLELTIRADDTNSNDSSDEQTGEFDLRCGLHQYGYNVGETPITLCWQGYTLDGTTGKMYTETVYPGDSFYMKPFISHHFRGEGKLLLLRIGGRLAGAPMRELSLLGEENIARVVGETIPWFNREGKREA